MEAKNRLKIAFGLGFISRKQIDHAIMKLPCFSLFGLRRGLKDCTNARQLMKLEKIPYKHPSRSYIGNIQSKECLACPLITPALTELTPLLPKR